MGKLEINGKVSGRFEIKTIRPVKGESFREAICILKTKIAVSGELGAFNQDFHDVVRSCMRVDGDGNISWVGSSIDGPNLRFDVHNMELNELNLVVTPRVKKVHTCENEAAVMVPIEFRVDLRSENTAGKLAFATSDDVDALFTNKQLEMPGTADNEGLKLVPGPHGNPTAVQA